MPERENSSPRIPLTMLLVTRDRQCLLNAVIRYHAPYVEKIVISDASATPWRDAARLASWGNVVYRHESEMYFLDRMAKLARDVDTPFATYRSDRRQVSNHALRACCCFLREHPDYASARGIDIWNGPHYTTDYLSGYGDIENPKDRTIKLMLACCPHTYNVVTADLAAKLGILYSGSPHNMYLVEGPVLVATGLAGKHKAFPFVHGYDFATNSRTKEKNIDLVEAEECYRDPVLARNFAEAHYNFFMTQFETAQQDIEDIFLMALIWAFVTDKFVDLKNISQPQRDLFLQTVFDKYKGTVADNYFDTAQKMLYCLIHEKRLGKFDFSQEDVQFVMNQQAIERHFLSAYRQLSRPSGL